MIKLKEFSGYLKPTVVSDGNGKFHPAVQHNHGVYYWPNIRDTNERAWEWAEKAIDDALDAANYVIEGWNVISITERNDT